MTPNSNETLERIARRIPIQEPAYERMLRRRDGKRRNQRIAAGVVGIAVFLAAIWIVTSVGSFDRTQKPANEPSTVNSAEDVARGFIAAFGAFDPEAAMTYVADDADLQGLIYPETSFVIPSPLVDPAAGRENLRMMLALMEAAGYQQTITSCQAAPFGSGTSVVCGFDFNAIASDELGLGPVTGNRFLFTVVDGEIVRAWVDWDTRTISSQLLKPFRDWVSATHPKDVRVMFGPPSKGVNGYLDPRYTNESIRLWRLRTPEYAESVQATAPVETGPAETGPTEIGFGQGPGTLPVPETDYLLDLNTGERTPLPESIVSKEDVTGDYAVSPDGSRLAFTGSIGKGRGTAIFVANLDGTGIEQVTNDFGPAFSPAWSPDGSKIAFIAHQGGEAPERIFVLDLATGMSTQVTDDPRDGAQSPRFSPDGSSIAYFVWRTDRALGEVRIVPVAGGRASGWWAAPAALVTPGSRRMVRSCPTPAAADGHTISAWRTPTEPTPGCSSRGSKARGVGRPTERGSRTGRLGHQVCTSWMLQLVS